VGSGAGYGTQPMPESVQWAAKPVAGNAMAFGRPPGRHHSIMPMQPGFVDMPPGAKHQGATMKIGARIRPIIGWLAAGPAIVDAFEDMECFRIDSWALRIEHR